MLIKKPAILQESAHKGHFLLVVSFYIIFLGEIIIILEICRLSHVKSHLKSALDWVTIKRLKDCEPTANENMVNQSLRSRKRKEM